MENYEMMMSLLEGMKKDLDLFYEKGNGSAGTRVRVSLQELKKVAQDLRIDIQETKKGKA